MKRIYVIAFSFILLFSAFSEEIIDYDGNFWTDCTYAQKVGYMQGYLAAQVRAYYDGPKVPQSRNMISRYAFNRVPWGADMTVERIVELINTFYGREKYYDSKLVDVLSLFAEESNKREGFAYEYYNKDMLKENNL